MAIPDFQEMMNTVLNIYASSADKIKPRDIEERVADEFNL